MVTLAVAVALGIGLWHYFTLKSTPDSFWYKHFLESYTWCNALMTLYLIYSAFVGGYHFIHATSSKTCALHAIIYIGLCSAFFTIPAFVPVRSIFFHCYYHWLVFEVLVCWFIIELSTIVLYHVKRASEPNEKTNVDVHWEQYVATVLSFLDDIPNATKSFTIGISGTWGTGKTTMLEYIKKNLRLNDRYIVRSFDPWQMSSPEQVNIEFFKLLRATIKSDSIDEKKILSSIKKYSQLLTLVPNTSLNSLDKILDVISDSSQKTISSLHQEINTSLTQMDKRIVICIDDLDRLDYEELYEVLKLIRVSANFNNLIFILAYDKQYVATNLNSHNIPNGEEFLKKIVNLEICLPSYEHYILTSLLWKKILLNFVEDRNTARDLSMSIGNIHTETGSLLIEKYFTNFRDVERFVNYFNVVLAYIRTQKEAGETIHLNYGDLFWLEVLHYFNEEVYNTLKTNKWELVEEKKYNKGQLEYKENNNFIENKKIDNRDVICLQYLFPKSSRYALGGIFYLNNYDNYFSYTSLDNTLSLPEFYGFINKQSSRDEFEKVINVWANDKKSSAFMALLSTFTTYIELTEVGQVNFVRTILYTAKYSPAGSLAAKNLYQQFEAICNSRMLERAKTFQSQVIEELDYAIAHYNIAENINYFLERLTTCYDYSSDPEDQHSFSLLPIEALKELALKNYHKFLEPLDVIPPCSDIFLMNNVLYKYFTSSSYLKSCYSDDETKESNEYSNLLEDAWLAIYPPIDTKLDDEQFITMMYPIAGDIVVEGMPELIPNAQHTVQKIFGNYDSFNRFVDAHFEISEETRKIYMVDLGLRSKKK